MSVVGIPNDKISDEMVQTLAPAFFEASTEHRASTFRNLFPDVQAAWRDGTREFLAAAVRYVEAEIRQRIVDELVDMIGDCPGRPTFSVKAGGFDEGLSAAARVARGTQETPNG